MTKQNTTLVEHETDYLKPCLHCLKHVSLERKGLGVTYHGYQPMLNLSSLVYSMSTKFEKESDIKYSAIFILDILTVHYRGYIYCNNVSGVLLLLAYSGTIEEVIRVR